MMTQDRREERGERRESVCPLGWKCRRRGRGRKLKVVVCDCDDHDSLRVRDSAVAEL